MRSQFQKAVCMAAVLSAAAGGAAYKAPRAPDGHADLSGIREALGTAKADRWKLDPEVKRYMPAPGGAPKYMRG